MVSFRKGQFYPVAHTLPYIWKMLKFGIKIKDGKRTIGQLPRLIFGGIKIICKVEIPVGNTGGANVPPLRSQWK